MSVLIELGCGFVLTVLHSLYSFFLYLKLLKLTFLKSVHNLNNILIGRKRKIQLDSSLIARSVESFSKLPKHLTFALGTEYVSYDDLAQIIVWTLSTGIPILSFYDHKNEVNTTKLYDTFQKRYPQLKRSLRWGVSFTERHYKEIDNNLTGMQVNVLTLKHGRQLLIDSIKELCQRDDITLTDRASTEAALDDIMLSRLSHCGNPDFMVISGNVYTTYGLSPWHLAFTEFLTIPSYRLLTAIDYIQILAKFAHCEQKFGR